VKTPKKASPFEAIYLKRLAFNERPFDAAVDTSFFFASRSHSDGLKALDAFIARKTGIALIYGDAGTGKTLVCTLFLDSLDKERFDACLIAHPAPEGSAFLAEIARQFNMSLPVGSSVKETADELGRCLMSRRSERMPVLAVDEAEALSDDDLDVLAGLLREGAAESGQPLRIVLFGRSELVTRFLDRGMERLRRHIATTHCLQTLSAEEVGAYIMHRLSKAGPTGLIRFTEDVLAGVHAASGGNPRIIGFICDRCLFLLQERSKTVVDAKVLREALKSENAASAADRERTGSAPCPAAEARSRLKVILPAALVVLIALAVLCLWLLGFRPFPGR
jgi:general secretion pathway protein A